MHLYSSTIHHNLIVSAENGIKLKYKYSYLNKIESLHIPELVTRASFNSFQPLIFRHSFIHFHLNKTEFFFITKRCFGLLHFTWAAFGLGIGLWDAVAARSSQHTLLNTRQSCRALNLGMVEERNKEWQVNGWPLIKSMRR